MPLSGNASGPMHPFPLPEKKVIVFNHRWNKSSGVERFLKYADYVSKYSDKYVFWITDQKNCDVERQDFIIRSLDYPDFNYLMANCHCNVTFIDGYTTWNLSAQDCLIRNKPSLIFDHPVSRAVCGPNAKYFERTDQFIHLLHNLPDKIENDYHLQHDLNFKKNLIEQLNSFWEDTKMVPKKFDAFKKSVEKGNRTKEQIFSDIHDSIISNGSNHGIRRHALHNGYKDDTNSTYPRYFKEDEEIIKELNLFSI